jgi:AraC family transcriptional regulator of adaptative response/methylated-DNA-[protein]-cysteine methyltransferase
MPLTLLYGIQTTPLGQCLIALAHNKIYCLAFLQPHQEATEYLLSMWPRARLVQDIKIIQPIVHTIFTDNNKLDVHLEGTEFQKTVWRALQRIQPGTTASYQTIAQKIGQPQAHRAVASAIAKNNIAYLIPCHRVIKKSGETGGYRWGASITKALLNYEKI